MLMPLALVGRLTLPAISIQAPDADWFAPSVLSRTGAEQPAVPERLSAPVNVTVTSVLFHPLALGSGDTLAEATGALLSIFNAGDRRVAVLPAASDTTTVPSTLDPSRVSTSGLKTDVETTPDKLSAVVKLTRTSLLFQPAAFGAGAGAKNCRVGAVVSMLMPSIVEVPVLPARSVKAVVTDWFRPCVVMFRSTTAAPSIPDSA